MCLVAITGEDESGRLFSVPHLPTNQWLVVKVSCCLLFAVLLMANSLTHSYHPMCSYALIQMVFDGEKLLSDYSRLSDYSAEELKRFSPKPAADLTRQLT